MVPLVGLGVRLVRCAPAVLDALVAVPIVGLVGSIEPASCHVSLMCRRCVLWDVALRLALRRVYAFAGWKTGPLAVQLEQDARGVVKPGILALGCEDHWCLGVGGNKACSTSNPSKESDDLVGGSD